MVERASAWVKSFRRMATRTAGRFSRKILPLASTARSVHFEAAVCVAIGTTTGGMTRQTIARAPP
jgi:hypothetical protein